jgi:hypothetical protein
MSMRTIGKSQNIRTYQLNISCVSLSYLDPFSSNPCRKRAFPHARRPARRAGNPFRTRLCGRAGEGSGQFGGASPGRIARRGGRRRTSAHTLRGRARGRRWPGYRGRGRDRAGRASRRAAGCSGHAESPIGRHGAVTRSVPAGREPPTDRQRVRIRCLEFFPFARIGSSIRAGYPSGWAYAWECLASRRSRNHSSTARQRPSLRT